MKKYVEKEDLFKLVSVATPIIAPNQLQAVFLKTVIDEKENTYYNYLYQLNLQTRQIQQLTFGKERISSVQWSPNSKVVSFISTREKEATLYILPIDGGEARAVVKELRHITSYQWYIDSATIYFTAKIEQDFFEEKREKKRPEAYHVDRMRYKLNGTGLLNTKQYAAFAKLDVTTGEITPLIKDETNYNVQHVSPDGQFVLLTNWSTEKDDDFSMQLLQYSIEEKTMEKIFDMDGSLGGATYSHDGAYIAFEVSPNEPYRNATHNEVYVYDVTQQSAWSLTAMMDLPVGDYAIGDVQQSVQAPSVVWTEGNDLYFQMSSMGDVRLYYATLSGAIYPATPEEEHIYGYDITKDGQYALITCSSPTTVSNLYLHEVTTGERHQLTQFNENYEQTHHLVKPEIIQVENEGQLVWGWLMKPAQYQEGQKYPLMLAIHGGPHMMYANTFMHEMQLLAAEGYGVLYMNPRGSHGYSQEFVNGCRGDYGGGDYRDLMAAVDLATSEYAWVDSSRLGVTGGSYGGFMTNWIIGHTDRFKAALTQRSISNWVSFFGVSDIGYYFTPWQIEGDMHDVNKLWEHSPLKYVKNSTTPLMILHGELDDRCPIEQAEQLYVTMKSMGKEVEFIRFEQANHDLSRTGLPNLRLQRLEAIQNWFVKKL